jgi:GNAT superfamily N-acetyltransferase
MNIKHTGTKFLKEYAQHLKALPKGDKYTRFGSSVNDYAIDKLILSMLYSPESHHLFAAKNGRTIVGFAHLCCDHGTTWELAVSVDSDQQGKGVGNKLMAAAIEWAKSNGVQSMFMHCINENKKIQHLARKHNLTVVEKEGGEITSKIILPIVTNTIISSIKQAFKRIANSLSI